MSARRTPGNPRRTTARQGMRARIDQLNRRAWNDMQTDFQEALALAREALAESERISYSEGGAFACLNIGWIMCYLGRSDESRVAFEKAQKYYAALDDPLGRSKALNGLGVMNYHVSRYERALDYYTQSLDVARRHGLRDREAATLNNIGEVCADLGNYKEGLDYFLKAYDTAPEAHSPELRAVILLNIGKSFVLQENFVLAEEFVRKALDLAESEKLSILVASCWDMLGRISRGTGDDPEAELRFRKAVALAEKFQSCREIIEAQLDLGSLLLGRGGIDEAWEILDRAARTADEVHANSLYFAALERLAEAHERKGDFRTALDYFRRYARYEREVQNEDTTRKIKDVQVQYEMERTLREAEIYRLRNIELKEKSDGLEEVNKQVLTISEIGRRITSSLDMATVISTLYESLCTLMVTDLFALAFYDSSTESLRYAAYIEDGQNIARGSVPLDPGKSFSAWCVRNASRVFIRDLESEYRDYLEGEPKNLQGRQGRSFIYLPLSIENTVIGVMMVQSWKKESYTDHHLRFLTALAPYVAIAMENAMIHVRMEELNHELKREKEQLERATQQISYLANHDSLTGLPNRRLLFELLRKSLEIAHRAGTKVGILYVDLDDFKPINDRFGHVAGDRTLAEIAARLQSALRASDTIARVGGDEFIAVLNQVRGRPDVEAAARKVLEACDAPIETLGEPCRIGASMGIAIFPDDGDTLEGILHCADSAMYTIKHTTKRGYAFYGAKS